MLFKVMQSDRITKEVNTDEGEMESESLQTFHSNLFFSQRNMSKVNHQKVKLWRRYEMLTGIARSTISYNSTIFSILIRYHPLALSFLHFHSYPLACVLIIYRKVLSTLQAPYASLTCAC